MRMLLVGAVMFLLVVELLRRVGRPLGELAMNKCQEKMSEHAPEWTPPERVAA